MKRDDALPIAEKLVTELSPMCERIQIVGSIRRMKPFVNDIDIVMQPKFGEHPGIKQRVWMLQGSTPEKFGDRIMRLANYKGIPVDFYFAQEDTWATLLLIRTGSKNHNIALCRAAQSMGMKLHASGYGFTGKKGEPIPIASERDIFMELGLPYRESWERE
jgi:DNA polymerase/3'-5' exonuclease PolX